MASVKRPQEWDGLVTQALLEKDDKAKVDLLWKLSKMAYDEAIVIPLYETVLMTGSHPYVHCDLGEWHNQQWAPADSWMSK